MTEADPEVEGNEVVEADQPQDPADPDQITDTTPDIPTPFRVTPPML